MLTAIHPKLPMRDKAKTRDYYNQLGFGEVGNQDYEGYLMVQKDQIQIHFFEFKELDPKENYGQVYIRTDSIEEFYQSLLQKKISIHPNGHLATKPWGQMEFSLLDPDNNLLTFGQAVE
ncbi:bleomycin resistance protein [Pararhodonellum marinum]|uniref:bleomycin resistance protein n=1 Tax=Pararhodonellum marinum TaxID=2755358 RepID=UPI00188EF9D8|nr:VOC family protein [Pararhodonellum marinum]